MKIETQITIAAPSDQVWKHLINMEALSSKARSGSHLRFTLSNFSISNRANILFITFMTNTSGPKGVSSVTPGLDKQ